MGRLGTILGSAWAVTAQSWAVLGCPGSSLDNLGAVSGSAWNLLGSAWAVLEYLGDGLGCLGAVLDRLGLSWVVS